MPKVASITRNRFSSDGTFGTFCSDDLVLFSGELPWNHNLADSSCIPCGEYRCRLTYSPRFKRNMYLVENVSGRSGIRFHSANFMGNTSEGKKSQLNGCIALGEKLGTINGQQALLISAPAIRRFEDLMDGEEFMLTISRSS